jgi:hypothetical protein
LVGVAVAAKMDRTVKMVAMVALAVAVVSGGLLVAHLGLERFRVLTEQYLAAAGQAERR